ncbi:MAG: hypothetical protein AAGG50_19130, partial [Bacteroidota bacterium]
MYRLLLFACAIALVAGTAHAQEGSYVFQGQFPDPPLDFGGLGGHGIAVDPDGKVWFEAFAATETVVVPALDNAEVPTRVIYVYNADGTPASFSPIFFVDYADGTTPRDTLGGFVRRNADGDLIWEGRSNRGLRTDNDGNILASNFNTLFKLDYQTGQGLARADFPDYCALTQATSDVNGNVYVSPVCPGPPIFELDSDLNTLANVTDVSSNFSRGIIGSPDGLNIYETAYENTYTIIHRRPDEFSPFDSVGVAFRGMRSESAAIHPTTGNLWVSAGNPLNLPNQDPEAVREWYGNTWYEFTLDDVNDLDATQTPLDSLVWGGCESFFDDPNTDFFDAVCTATIEGVETQLTGRPRGIDFSDDGMRAYVTAFSALPTDPGGQVQVFELVDVAIEEGAELPSTVALGQNYPNPFINETKIGFKVEEAAQVQLVIYDMLGREVAMPMNEYLTPDDYTATVDTRVMA